MNPEQQTSRRRLYRYLPGLEALLAFNTRRDAAQSPDLHDTKTAAPADKGNDNRPEVT